MHLSDETKYLFFLKPSLFVVSTKEFASTSRIYIWKSIQKYVFTQFTVVSIVVLAKCIRGCVPPPKQNKKCESSSTKIMYNLNYNVRSSTMSSNKIDHHNVSQKNENLSMKQN